MQKGVSSLLRVAMMLTICALVAPLMAEETEVASGTSFSATPANTGDQAVKKFIKIGNATVQIVLNAGNAFIIVKDGPLNLTYADGSPMCTLQSGQGVQASGFMGGGSGVTVEMVNGKPTLKMAPALGLNVTLGNKGNPVEFHQPGQTTPTTLQPGGKATLKPDVKVFQPGEEVKLKPGQVGFVAGSHLGAFGNADGSLTVSSVNGSASLNGAGGDKVNLGPNSMVTITSGTLTAGAGGTATLSGDINLKNTGGDVGFQRGGTTYPVKLNQTVHVPASQTDNNPPGNTPPPIQNGASTPVNQGGRNAFNMSTDSIGFDETTILGSFTKSSVLGAQRDEFSPAG